MSNDQAWTWEPKYQIPLGRRGALLVVQPPVRRQLWRHRFLELRTQPDSCQGSGTSALGILDSGGLPGSRTGSSFKFQNSGPSQPKPARSRATESWVCPENLGWESEVHASRETQRGRWLPPRTTQCCSGPEAGMGMVPYRLGALPALLANVGGKGGLARCLYWPARLGNLRPVAIT